MITDPRKMYSRTRLVSRLLSSPNIQSGKYNEMDPILIGTAVSVVSYTTDSTALVPSRNVCREGTSAIKSV